MSICPRRDLITGIRLYKEGYGCKLASRMSGCPLTTLKRKLRKLGIVREQTCAWNKGKRFVTEYAKPKKQKSKLSWKSLYLSEYFKSYGDDCSHWVKHPLEKRRAHLVRVHTTYRNAMACPKRRMKKRLRVRLWRVLKGAFKSAPTLKLLGCSLDELKKHFESKFKPGMSWDNMGKWHIDHVIPCSFFDLTCPIEQSICFHYTNLQPLWELENRKKGKKMVYGEN